MTERIGIIGAMESEVATLIPALEETGEKYEKKLEGYLKLFQSKGGSMGN